MAMSSSDLDASGGCPEEAVFAKEALPAFPESTTIGGSSCRVELLELKLSPLER
jgi:hypothetical protein